MTNNKHYHVYLGELTKEGRAPMVLSASLDPDTGFLRRWESRTPANNYARMRKLQHYVAYVRVCLGNCKRKKEVKLNDSALLK